MSIESSRKSEASPDAVFARACFRMFAAGIIIFLIGHLAVAHVVSRQVEADRLANARVAAVAGARTAVAGIDHLPGLPAGMALETARKALLASMDALAAPEEGAGSDAVASPRASDLAEAAATARSIASRADFSHQDAAALKVVFGGRILPALEAAARDTGLRAERAANASRMAILGSAAGNLLGALLILLGVAVPAHRRIAAWVSRSREAEEEHRFRLLHDPLTGMPNRAYLEAYLTRTVAGLGRNGLQTAVLSVDLDRFETLGETLGERVADEVMRISARRIQQSLRAIDFAAHLGEDRFVVVAGELADANDAPVIAQRIQNALRKPFSVRGGARRIECRIGVTLISDDVAEPARILSNAGIALAEARHLGPGSVRYFRDDMRDEVERREALFADLFSGLEAGQLVPFFQPQIDLRTGEFAGFEALARWLHPERGLLGPAEFLDFAEKSGLTERIGEIVLNASLGAINAWDAAGLTAPKVGVNFALGQLRDPRLIEKIKWEVERFDVDPSRVAIEVLETVLIKNDQDMVVRNLRGLASAGFHIELDDFGTGHASISNLRRFMVNRIKIDRGFIDGIERSEELRTLTASMVAMADALGIGTLAEGVETSEARDVVRDLGCGQLQGNLVAKPMPLAETFDWLRGWRASRAPADDGAPLPARDPNTP